MSDAHKQLSISTLMLSLQKLLSAITESNLAKSQLQPVSQNIDILQQQLNFYQKQTGDNDVLQLLHNQVDAHYQTIKDQIVEIKELRQTIATQQSQIQGQVADFSVLQQNSFMMQMQVSKMQSTLQQVKEHDSKSEKQLIYQERLLKSREAQIANLQHQVIDKNEALQQAQEHLQYVKDVNEAELQKTKAENANTINSLNSKLQTAQKNLQTAQELVTSQQEQFKIQQNEANQLSIQGLEFLQTQNQQAQLQIQNLCKKIEEYKTEVKKQQVKYEQLEGITLKLQEQHKNEINALQDHFTQKLDTQIESQNEIQQLHRVQSINNTSQPLITQLNEQLNNTKTQLTLTQQQLASKQTENGQLKLIRKQLEEQICNINIELKNAKLSSSQSKETTFDKTLHKKLQDDVKQLQNQNDTLKKQINQYKIDLEKINENDKMKIQITNLQKELSEFKNQVRKLKGQPEKIEHDSFQFTSDKIKETTKYRAIAIIKNQ
ncbi:Hypothetical_protein [Hexamita inflata]|uniref:Hypothetical_protein n=1 Tax=Hexamita inflata TaxID=28002 RepID=A0AA86RGV6_9EUKA|nr:Hypothetical protein HINF_LOCUS65914 [Hexamita inflata]